MTLHNKRSLTDSVYMAKSRVDMPAQSATVDQTQSSGSGIPPEMKLYMQNSEDAKQMQIVLADNEVNVTSADGVHLVECIRGDWSSVKSLRDAIVTSAQALSFMGEAIPAGWMHLKDDMHPSLNLNFYRRFLWLVMR